MKTITTNTPHAIARTLAVPALLACAGSPMLALAQNIPPATSPPAATPPAASPPASSPPPAPAFKLFRYDEDYSALADPAKRTGAFDQLKYIPLADDGRAFLSLGGEARTRYEHTSAPGFGLRSPDHDDYVLQRFLLHADTHVGKFDDVHGRAFVQLVSGSVFGSEIDKPGTQDNLLDVQQAFADITFGDNRAAALNAGGTAFSLRAGRQEMGFGSFRLVTMREPTNARLNFDGVRATLSTDRMAFDAFLVRPVDQKIGLVNDGQDDNTTFWGVYAAIPLAPQRKLGIDVYYLGLNRERARFASGIGDERRHSIGTRLWGRDAGWDHDTEALIQVGTFDRGARSEDILAWTVASNTGYTFEGAAWKPRVGLKLNIASGDDDPNDGRLGTFNPLFPRNNYFNDANLLAPYNFFDAQPSVSIAPNDRLTLTAGWDFFFRYSADDAVFSPTGITIPAAASRNRFVGSAITFVADWTISRHVSLSGSYVRFLRGDVVKDAGGRDVDFFGAWLTAKF